MVRRAAGADDGDGVPGRGVHPAGDDQAAAARVWRRGATAAPAAGCLSHRRSPLIPCRVILRRSFSWLWPLACSAASRRLSADADRLRQPVRRLLSQPARCDRAAGAAVRRGEGGAVAASAPDDLRLCRRPPVAAAGARHQRGTAIGQRWDRPGSGRQPRRSRLARRPARRLRADRVGQARRDSAHRRHQSSRCVALLLRGPQRGPVADAARAGARARHRARHARGRVSSGLQTRAVRSARRADLALQSAGQRCGGSGRVPGDRLSDGGHSGVGAGARVHRRERTGWCAGVGDDWPRGLERLGVSRLRIVRALYARGRDLRVPRRPIRRPWPSSTRVSR